MINYVIAAWSGLRRGKVRPTRTYEAYLKDRTFYLRFHLDRVLKIKKHISHITIVAPFNFEAEPKEFSDYLEALPEEIDGVGITVLRRENVGVSYGSYSYAFEKMGTAWKYYIFQEDDFIPVPEGFDDILVKALRAKNRETGKKKNRMCGCVCAFLRRDRSYKKTYIVNYRRTPVIGHNLSIAKSSVLSKVAAVNGGTLPYMFDVYSGLSADKFSMGFYNAGYRIEDTTREWDGAFAKGNGEIRLFFHLRKNPRNPLIVAPIELWYDENKALRQRWEVQ